MWEESHPPPKVMCEHKLHGVPGVASAVRALLMGADEAAPVQRPAGKPIPSRVKTPEKPSKVPEAL